MLLGHGRDYAWSATTATSDNVDTFAEVLCRDNFHYRYKGKCLPMQKLDRTNSWTPSAIDQTPPGRETLNAYRTVHGIVYARGKVHGKKVAFVRARSTYFHEADSALVLHPHEQPALHAARPESFRRAAKDIELRLQLVVHGLQAHRLLPDRLVSAARAAAPRRTSRSSAPGSTTGRGMTPTRARGGLAADRTHPHAVDQHYLVSWNNKQAPAGRPPTTSTTTGRSTASR